MRCVRCFGMLAAFAVFVLGNPAASTTLTVYVLDIETNIKGDFSAVAPALTSALETAFADRHVFQILDRRNLNLIVKQNQLEKDIQALGQGGQPSQRFIQLVKGADGFIHGELVSGPDGVVLTVTLTGLDSRILWKGESAAHTLAEWQLRAIQKMEAETLAAKAEARLAAPAAPAAQTNEDGPRGLELARSGKCSEASPFLQNATAVDSGNAELYYWMGRCQNQTGDFETATRTLTAGLSRNARRADLFSERAQSFIGQKAYSRALDDLDQALKLDPRSAVSIELRGDVFVQLGHYDDAVNAYYTAYQLQATRDRCRKLADAYKRNGASDPAFERSCTILP